MIKKRSISVSELGAYAGSCEMQGHLKYHHGVAKSAKTAQSVSGERLHAQMAHQAIAYERARGKAVDRRCYVATAVFGGDSDQARILRMWRDTELKGWLFGGALITLYYGVSPLLCRYIKKGSVLERAIRACLNLFISRLSIREPLPYSSDEQG